ncbi:hypothetical protein H0E87_015183 [Populus deltoides]|uniref:Uncharacterized protein n=1 Tax=Populus deltoides TaxID=3696 RepID=A0A8T2Y449_POPDE|nr:hypothetical protein H0E87_015183 [Populus deltoides]
MVLSLLVRHSRWLNVEASRAGGAGVEVGDIGLAYVVEVVVGLQWKKLLEGDQETVDNSTVHLNKEGACLYWWLKAFLLLFTVEVDGVANLEVERLH